VDVDAEPSLIFAVWDHVARIGLDKAVDDGLISASWVAAALHHVPCDEATPDEEAFYASSLRRYARGRDLDQVLLMYSRLENGKSNVALNAIHDFNKVRFYYMLEQGLIAGNDETEIAWVRFKLEHCSRGNFLAWLLNGHALTADSMANVMKAAGRKVYPDIDERELASDIRENSANYRAKSSGQRAYKIGIEIFPWDTAGGMRRRQEASSEVIRTKIIEAIDGIDAGDERYTGRVNPTFTLSFLLGRSIVNEEYVIGGRDHPFKTYRKSHEIDPAWLKERVRAAALVSVTSGRLY
jgi:hypothetical protein